MLQSPKATRRNAKQAPAPKLVDVETEDYPVAHMTFEPVSFDFESIPNNEEAARDMIKSMPTYRFAALLTRLNDKELEEITKKEPEAFVELAECVVSELKVVESRRKLLELAFSRLCVVLERQ